MYPLTDAEYRFESESKVLRVEKLRAILETEQNRPISYAEAEKIAEKIINFFLILADHAPIIEEPTFQSNVATVPPRHAFNQLLTAPIEGT